MSKYKETFATWDKMASLYQEKFMNLDLYNDTYDFVCDTIAKKNPKILEIGCGPGNITSYILSKRPDFDVFGIDVAPKMVELAKKNNPTAKFAVMDSRQIDNLQTKYDGIVCGFCLPYLSHKDSVKLIKDSYGLLHNGGLIYLSFVEGDAKESGYKANNSGDRVYFHFHDLDSLKKILTENNFGEFKKSESEMDTHTILMAKKTK
jgi:SAM-dependent methyltransferase